MYTIRLCRICGILSTLTLCLLSQLSHAWVVDNLSSSASESNSLRWVAAQINAGAPGGNYVYFSIPGTPPHVFTFVTTFNKPVNFYANENVLFANNIYFNSTTLVSRAHFTNSTLFLMGPGSVVDTCTFSDAVAHLEHGSTFLDNNITRNGQITLGRNNLVYGANQAHLQINFPPNGGNVVSNSVIRRMRCYGDNNVIVHNTFTEMSQIFGSHNTYAFNRLNMGWNSGMYGSIIGGQNNSVTDNVIISNQWGFFLDRGGNHTLMRNHIGCDSDGVTPHPNSSGGIYLYKTQDNIIGGNRSTDRNVIGASSNGYAIVVEGGANNRIVGNLIGIGADGTTILPNHGGIWIFGATQTVVGTATQGNIIGGSHLMAINAGGVIGLHITGNRIGTKENGIIPAPNGWGVTVGGAGIVIAGNVIGSTRYGAGIALQHAHNAHVWANTIGLDLTGKLPLPNGDGGIHVRESNYVTIGGEDGYNRNLIAANTAQTYAGGYGVVVQGGVQDCRGTRVINNRIGVDITGQTFYPNERGGVLLLEACGVTVGHHDFPPNIIAGNDGPGVVIDSDSMHYPSTNNLIAHNHIFQNTSHGVVTRSVHVRDNMVYGNRIENNAENGVDIALGLRNTISSNSIYGNALMGINLGAQGRNDGPEDDTHPNRYQRYPTITTAVVGDGTRVQGVLESAPDSTYTLEFFASPIASPAGFAEGALYLGARTVSTDNDGSVAFNLLLPSSASPGALITATATDAGGNTSELSEEGALAGIMADFSVSTTLGIMGVPIHFTDHSIGEPLSWEWDFENSGEINSAAQHPSHTYTTPGDKSVRLVVSNASGSATLIKVGIVRIAHARSIAGPTDNIQQIINESQPYDVIALESGVYRLPPDTQQPYVLMIPEHVTLIGADSPEDTIIDGEGLRRALYVSGGRAANLTIMGGRADTMPSDFITQRGRAAGHIGGGVLLESGELDRVIIRDCIALEGGGVYAVGEGWIRSSLIISNSAEKAGGMVMAGAVDASNLTIAHNSASQDTGGILLYSGELWNAIVYHNTAPTNANWQRLQGEIHYSCTSPHPGDLYSIDSDPGLYADYRLPLSSPCVDSGYTFEWMSSAYDLDDESRVFGVAPDMGAYEAIPEPSLLLIMLVFFWSGCAMRMHALRT